MKKLSISSKGLMNVTPQIKMQNKTGLAEQAEVNKSLKNGNIDKLHEQTFGRNYGYHPSSIKKAINPRFLPQAAKKYKRDVSRFPASVRIRDGKRDQIYHIQFTKLKIYIR
ncbi:hypothetical protein ACTXT7_003537 [Hymenolepis weldensis]